MPALAEGGRERRVAEAEERAPVRAANPRRPPHPVIPPQAPGSFREQKCRCPGCNSLVPIGAFEGGPFPLGFYVVDIGGAVRPGKVRVSPSGRVTDHSHNTRGSIDVQPAWDPALALAVEEQVGLLFARAADAAEAGELAEMGEDG